ncbi:MAG: (d)CMP kinase [Deltaproteobacteria bacterium]|nr:(d)CMP kinase [Deltaproteobacteria bacterium]
MRESKAEKVVIAIDGPAGVGKSVVARRVAESLGATLLDTGAIYRTLALEAERQSVAWDEEEQLAGLARDLAIAFQLVDGENRVFLGGEDISSQIRTPHISSGASRVSAFPAVRGALMEMQRAFAARTSVVAEGRDMGTIVFPGATAKIFLTASAAVRAQRRFEQLRRGGRMESSLEEVRQQQDARDLADSERAVAPLRAADDALVVDTSEMPLEGVIARVLVICRGEIVRESDA